MALRRVPILNDLESVIGYKFKNVHLLQEALQVISSGFRSSKSAAVGTPRDECAAGRFLDGNKRLTIVGNTVLRTALLEDWYHKGYSRGFIAHILGEVASNHNLNLVGRRHRLDKFIDATRTSTAKLPPGCVADTFEAVLGAACVDNGMTSVRKMMFNVGLEYKALHQAKSTEDGHSQGQRKHLANQQGPAYRMIQSTQQLQCCVDDVLQPTYWTQLQTASVDPLGVLRRAMISGSQCLYLLTECRDILLNSAILRLDLTFMDTVRSAHELRTLIYAWENHMKLRCGDEDSIRVDWQKVYKKH